MWCCHQKKELTENEVVLGQLAITDFLVQGVFTVIHISENSKAIQLSRHLWRISLLLKYKYKYSLHYALRMLVGTYVRNGDRDH